MGREIEITESEVSKFDKKMRKPQAASMSKDWEGFKKFFEEDNNALLEPFDLSGNTAIHVATRSNNPCLLRELLETLPESNRWRALRMKNKKGDTLLHKVILRTNVEMVDVVLNYEKGLQPPSDEEINDDSVRPLLDLKNNRGETPLYKAAGKSGKLSMVKHVAKLVDDVRKHLFRDMDKHSILHASIVGQHFDVAIWLLINVEGILAEAKDDNGWTCLQLLSKMPKVFRSQSPLGIFKSLIYYFLPEVEYELNDKSIKVFRLNKDLESGQGDKGKQPPSVISRINYAIWKLMAKEWDPINRLWKAKKQHKMAEKLAGLLVERDISWQNSFDPISRSLVILPVIRPTNVAAAKKQSDEQKKEKPALSLNYTPLLLASSTGIVEIVEKILLMNPQAITHVSEDGNNVLHMAIKHRQLEIYHVLKKNPGFKSLRSQITDQGHTLLHQTATMEYFKGKRQPGIAFQLQDELRWFHRVKRLVPRRLLMHCDNDGHTAEDLFDREHQEMVNKAQDWIKDTAQSCSTVAVLVATVVFAAAYTIPGGTDTSGIPIFLHSPVFLFFTIMDVVGLASSLASVVMFLSILTSPFEMWDFHKSLPRKLTVGFTMLFFSLITTMLAFSATVLLTIRLDKKKWTSTLIYSAAFFPVTIFGIMQFPIYIAMHSSIMQILRGLKKLVPSSLVKSSRRFKKIIY